MKILRLFFCSLFLASSGAFAQNIAFTDLKLKAFLVNKICVDTDNDSIPDAVADANADGEIQISEALAVIDLEIEDFSPPRYWIKSMADLSHFQNVQRLTLIHNDSLVELANLGLDSLNFLWIGTLLEIKRIDLSDLPGVTSLRIEDIGGLEYLNLKNGSHATQLFSLFYTQDIKYACVDSIAAEYNVVAQHMSQTNPILTTVCDTLTNLLPTLSDPASLVVYPNPSSANIFLEADFPIEQVQLVNSLGKVVFESKIEIESVDLSSLPSGLYFLQIDSPNGRVTQKVVRE